MHARNDVRVTSAPGRAAFLARFEREVDPDGVLPAAERERRAQAARNAYFARLAMRSSVRRATAASRVNAGGEPRGRENPPESRHSDAASRLTSSRQAA